MRTTTRTANGSHLTGFIYTVGDTYLEDSEQRLVESVEVVAWYRNAVVEAELTAKQLHAEQSEDDDEEKEQQQEAGDRAHAVDQRRH